MVYLSPMTLMLFVIQKPIEKPDKMGGTRKMATENYVVTGWN
jgi:hypothetical protein